MIKKKILFFFVHPSKYHLFKHTIRKLKGEGHEVDIAIITKDVLEELVKAEGWEYTNIFPEGRRIQGIPTLVATGINLIRTLYRLWKLTRKKDYDLYVTDDSLTITGWFQRVPSLMFTDDDLKTAPENALLYFFASKIISPYCTDLGYFHKKKIPFKGYKELTYLRPEYFTPDRSKVECLLNGKEGYVLIRLVSLTASHDRGKKGIGNVKVLELIEILKSKFNVFISSERPLSVELESYRLKIDPMDMAHVLYFASLFIGDSQTMTSEAALLGTPAVRFNDFVGKINSMQEKEDKYKLAFGFKTDQFEEMKVKVKELINTVDLKEEWKRRRDIMLNDTIDVAQFLTEIIKNFN